MYKALAAELRAEIEAGDFPPTRRLPTDAELSAGHGVSRQTARQAFNELVAEGLVYRVRGRGSFALARPDGPKYLRSLGSVDDLLALSQDTSLEVVQPLRRTVDVAAAGRLRLPTDDVVAGVFRRLYEQAPFSVTHVYLPLALGAVIAKDERVAHAGTVSPATMIALVDDASEHPIAGAHQSVSASTADEPTAALIDCRPGDPVLTIDRVYFDATGAPVELAVSAFNVERYSYRLELRRNVRPR
jgi:DNA-binding GntR family transcriptional regulator